MKKTELTKEIKLNHIELNEIAAGIDESNSENFRATPSKGTSRWTTAEIESARRSIESYYDSPKRAPADETSFGISPEMAKEITKIFR